MRGIVDYVASNFVTNWREPMCTVVVAWQPGHSWPLLLAANRDEMENRPWDPPGRHWPDRPHVIAGLDRLAGGSWLGLNDDGVVAGVLNRRHSLGPDTTLRSRGELVLEALDHSDADAAAAALSDLDGRSYRSFNMVIADNRDAFWLCNRAGENGGRVEAGEIPEGISMLTAHDLNDPTSGRVSHFRPLFEAAPVPDPESGNWRSWQVLLGSTEHGEFTDSRDAMNVRTEYGFGTLSSSVMALPERLDVRPVWLFAAGPPAEAPFREVRIRN